MSVSPIARVKTVAFSGIEVIDVDVQVAMTGSLVAFTIVGLPDKAVAEDPRRPLDLIDVKGQESTKRALEIAAAGGHNLLLLRYIN